MKFRAYTMMVVLVLGLVLASMSTILLYATERDRSEGRQQQRNVAALYAAEAGVAVGIEQVRVALAQSLLAPDLDAVEIAAKALATNAVPGVSFAPADGGLFDISFYDFATNTTSSTQLVSGLQSITVGPNKGLKAEQSPVQVLVTASFENALATLADAIRVDLIPIFQFALFFDGDLETLTPAPMSINGRVHANGDLWMSNGGGVDFLSKVTAAGTIHSRSATSSSITVGTAAPNVTRFKTPANSLLAVATGLPRATISAQASYLNTNYGSGDANMLGDSSTGIERLAVPLSLSGGATCTVSSGCGAGRSCVKTRTTDTNGVCMDNIVGRPPVCGDGSSSAFPQSIAVEVIKRPAKGYANSGTGAPYATGAAVGSTDIYTADFGPRPAIARAASPTLPVDTNDLFEVEVPRSVPLLSLTTSDDDAGALNDRMWWKADIFIIDGVWYKRGQTAPVFDPEMVNYVGTPPNPADLNHKFARVLRYSWWWDARENRVYCQAAADKNCVGDGNEYQRGLQIRATDFDAAEFMALLDDATARALLFPGGIIPAQGIVVYLSETYDPKYEDANAKLPRAANVRNFLSFPYLHNHLLATDINVSTPPLPPRTLPSRSVGVTPGRTPYQAGWYPENIWGIHAPAPTHRSLTRPLVNATTLATSQSQLIAAYTNPYPGLGLPFNPSVATTFDCQINGNLNAAQTPASRPASFATPVLKAPCIQAGATPLGAENAVRIVRAQSLPSQGFTFVTDNRLYLHGNINVRNDNNTGSVTNSVNGTTLPTRQDIGGKMAFLADSITILSERFDDRMRQNGHYDGFFKPADDPSLRTFTNAPTRFMPWTSASTAGGPVNFCQLGNEPSESSNTITALATLVNASLLMGDVPACINAGSLNGNESGGVNNFPRFLEDWGVNSSAGDIPLVINGSMVGLFRSERGNSRFPGPTFTNGAFPTLRTGTPYQGDNCTYNPPLRLWSFDGALSLGSDKLPPGTPRVVATDRLRWIRR